MEARLRVGDRVEDRDTHHSGTIKDELVVVRFDDCATPLAIHVGDLRRLQRRVRR